MFDAPQAVQDFPALGAPPGIVPHMTRTSPDQKWYYISAPLLTVVPGIFMALHLYTKSRIARQVEFPDYLIAISFVVLVGIVCIGRVPVHYGLGVHQWNIRIGDLMRQLYWLNLLEALYCPCIFLVKTAIVLQYLKILAPTRNMNKFMWYGGRLVIAGMSVFYVVVFPLTLFICSPREKIWNPFYEGGSCGDQIALLIAASSFNAISDLIVLLLPVHSIWHLQISQKKKVVLALSFATGLLATFAATMRMSYVVRLKMKRRNQDYTYELAFMGLWGYAECSLALIVACALSLPRLFRAKAKELSHLLSLISYPFSSLKSSLQGLSEKSRSNGSVISETSLQDIQKNVLIRRTTEIVQEPDEIPNLPSKRSQHFPGDLSGARMQVHQIV